MADLYKINTRDVDDTSTPPADAYYVPTDNIGTPALPVVSSTDNGNVMTVVNGKWAKAPVASQLPAVTAADNGDVLSVSSGAWAKAAAPIVYASITADTTGDNPVYHCDKTLAELLEAIGNGSFVICRHGDVFSPMSGYSNDNVTFSDYYIYDGKLTVNSITVAAEDAITTAEMKFTADV